MFRISDHLFRLKNKKKLLGNSVDNKTIEKIKCQRCLRRFEAHYIKCPYCDYSELFKSIIVDFVILRSR